MARKRRKATAKPKARAKAKIKAKKATLKRKPAVSTKKKRPLREPVKKAKRATRATLATRGTPGKLSEFGREIKRKAPPVRAKPETKKAAKRKAKLSRNPEAVRARRYRAEKKAVAEALAAAREERLARRRAQRRAKKIPPTERELSLGWLERIRNDTAEIASCSLEIVEPRAGDPNMWFAVGRLEFLQRVDYQTMGAVLERLADDIELEATIHPMRLSQIRVAYHDPNARGSESDGTISSIGPWSFILGELVGEILGGGGDNDHNALAVRYEQSVVGTFWVYFAADLRSYTTAPAFAAGARTVSVPLKR